VLVRSAHINLNERSGQLLFFPWSRRFAGPQPNDDVLPADRLPWVKRDILDDSVALVEDAEHRHPLRHRRDSAFAVGG
jgi:hypothetical protein